TDANESRGGLPAARSDPNGSDARFSSTRRTRAGTNAEHFVRTTDAARRRGATSGHRREKENARGLKGSPGWHNVWTWRTVGDERAPWGRLFRPPNRLISGFDASRRLDGLYPERRHSGRCWMRALPCAVDAKRSPYRRERWTGRASHSRRGPVC